MERIITLTWDDPCVSREEFDTIHDRHLDIQENDIRLNVFEQIKQLHAVVSFSYQFDIFLNGKCCFDASPKEA